MPLKIRKSTEKSDKPFTLNILIYGNPGVGKTTFAANAEKALVADAESGTKMLGVNGVTCDVAEVSTWDDVKELYEAAVKDDTYKTIVLDPLGEIVDKLLTKLKQEGYSNGKDGLTLAGWGVAKERFRAMIRAFRDADKDVVLVAHSNEKRDEEGSVVRPKLPASLDEDVCAMMDAVGYMTPYHVEKDKTVRRIYFSPHQRFYAKSRGNVLPEYVDNSSFRELKAHAEADPLIARYYHVLQKAEANDAKFMKELEDTRT